MILQCFQWSSPCPVLTPFFLQSEQGNLYQGHKKSSYVQTSTNQFVVNLHNRSPLAPHSRADPMLIYQSTGSPLTSTLSPLPIVLTPKKKDTTQPSMPDNDESDRTNSKLLPPRLQVRLKPTFPIDRQSSKCLRPSDNTLSYFAPWALSWV